MPSKMLSRTDRGQALAETALILGVLLFIIFAMVESARLFQANLTVQNAAREAGRYALTGNFDPSCLTDIPPCPDPRVASIKAVAEENLAGLPLNPGAVYNDPQYYLVEVMHNEDGAWVADSAGGPGDPVMVRVTYRVGILTPFVNAIARTVRVSGQVVYNNEEYQQYSDSTTSDRAPNLPPPPTVGPSPTPIPPDMKLTKTDYPDPAIAGETLEYILFVQNQGDVDATGVVITDTLPANVVVEDAGGCAGTTVLTCDMGTIPGQGSASVTIKVRPEMAAVDTTVTNNAIVRANEFDPDLSSNEASVQTDVVAPTDAADVGVRKTAPTNLIAENDEFRFNVVVFNNGLAEAKNVEIVDVLPDTVAFRSTEGEGSCTHSGEATGGTVTCEFGNLARDASASVAILVEALVEGTVSNTATVTSDSPDPVAENNTDSAEATVENAADLGVVKNLSPNPGLNEPITYTVAVFNNGPADASEVVVEDSLPPEVNFAGFGTDVDRARCGESGRVVTCTIGDLADGATDFVRIVVNPTVEALVTNYVSVSGNEGDWYAPNDNDTLTSKIQARADLEVVSITDTPDPVESGEYLDYVVTVRNNGPSGTEGVQLEQTLPADTTFVSASASQGTCREESTVVSCSLEALGVGDTATVKIRVIPIQASDGSISTQATVSGAVTDPNLTNNVETASTWVEAYTFLTLDPICGQGGTVVTVQGYNWSANNNEDLIITWDPAGPDAAVELVNRKIEGKTNDTGLSWTQTITVPQSAGWRQTHTIQAETKWIVHEASFQVPCPAPDLQIVSPPQVVTPTTVLVGDTITFTVDITNSGDLDAINQFFVGLYFDPQPAPVLTTTTHISQEFRVDLEAISGLAAGRGRTLTFTVPSAFSSAGIHEVYAVVDSDPADVGLITTELIETNNVSAPLEVTVDEDPDATEEPQATPTATPENPGGINGIVYAPAPGDNLFPQQNAEVFVIDSANTVIATTFTNNSGEYFFTNLEPQEYSMRVCITIDDVSYADGAAGVVVTAGTFTRMDFVLEAGLPCTAP